MFIGIFNVEMAYWFDRNKKKIWNSDQNDGKMPAGI